MPQWQLGKSVSLDSLNQVTDAYLKSLEPSRKLSVPAVPATVKDSLAAFARSAGQDKSAGELVDLVTKAMADKAVVVEDGKPVQGFQVRARLVLRIARITNTEAGNKGSGPRLRDGGQGRQPGCEFARVLQHWGSRQTLCVELAHTSTADIFSSAHCW